MILWVNQATLAEISVQAADFYSWRSATLFIEPPPGWSTLESSRRGYLQALVTENEFVNLQGLAPVRGGQIVQMRMEDIFIPLRAEQEVKPADVWVVADPISFSISLTGEARMTSGVEEVEYLKGSTEIRAQSLHSPRPSANNVDREKMPPKRRDDGDRYAHKARREVKTRPVEIPELLRERQAIVLGDPGAGKTTLLRYVAYILARSQIAHHPTEIIRRRPDLAACLPVYVRIGEYAEHLRQNPGATLDAFAPLGCQVCQLPLTDALLEDPMAQGRILFLLDGLDEIMESGQRREVAQHIEQLALSHPGCRLLVTSRIMGYREAQLSEKFSRFTIRSFEDEEVRRFAKKWYYALGKPESAEKLVEAFREPSIRRLASNPLLLTVIALIHWRGARLPNHRITLYRVAAETLVDQWMSYRRVSPEGWDVQETLQVLLPAIAWHLHQTASSGLIGEDELRGLLVETLRQKDSRLSENEAHCRTSQFLRNVSEFSGIFLERGLDPNDRGIYGFLHLTFEEYFAALCLADRWEREGDRALKPLLHDPRWTEVVLLTAGHFGVFSPH